MLSPAAIGVKKIVLIREAHIPTKVDPTKVGTHAAEGSAKVRALSFRRASEARQEGSAVHQRRISCGCTCDNFLAKKTARGPGFCSCWHQQQGGCPALRVLCEGREPRMRALRLRAEPAKVASAVSLPALAQNARTGHPPRFRWPKSKAGPPAVSAKAGQRHLCTRLYLSRNERKETESP